MSSHILVRGGMLELHTKYRCKMIESELNQCPWRVDIRAMNHDVETSRSFMFQHHGMVYPPIPPLPAHSLSLHSSIPYRSSVRQQGHLVSVCPSTVGIDSVCPSTMTHCQSSVHQRGVRQQPAAQPTPTPNNTAGCTNSLHRVGSRHRIPSTSLALAKIDRHRTDHPLSPP